MGARGAGIGARGAGMGARLRGAGRGAGMGARSRELITSRASAYACSVMIPCLRSSLIVVSMALIITVGLRSIYLRGVISLT